jgi:ABC-2 type transport system permease protein
MIAAFAYLLLNSWRNRLQSQLRRLRTPRYAIGFAIGILYFWGFLGRNLMRQPAHQPGLPLAGLAGSPFEALAPVFIAIVIAGIWIFGGDMNALAFSEAEVSMLLTAPVPRRGLILYKLAQSQFAILINVLIWTFILRRGNSTLPPALSAASVWVMFTTLNLHRMGQALSRASSVEYRAAGRRSSWAAKLFVAVVGAAILMAIVLGPLSEIGPPDASNPVGFLRSIVHIFESPGVRAALYPFRLVIAPSFAHDAGAWAVAMLPALAIVLLHVFWVLRSDAAFEEAAALAATRQAQRIEAVRSRRSTLGPPTAADGKTIALAPTGVPAVAIAWKNAIGLRRTLKIGALLRLPILVLVFSLVVGWKSGSPATVVCVVALIMAIVLPLILSQALRHDLRADMMHLPLLKSLPLAGGDLVLAEVASGAVPMAAVQLVLFAIAGIAFYVSPRPAPVPASVLVGIALTLPVTLLALDGAFCTIVNGSAVLFPAWIRLGPGGAGGVEVMGQAMLGMIASLLAFTLLLIAPAAAGAGIFFVLKAFPGPATALACMFGAALLGAECYFLIQALGHAYERAEPQQVS